MYTLINTNFNSKPKKGRKQPQCRHNTSNSKYDKIIKIKEKRKDINPFLFIQINL